MSIVVPSTQVSDCPPLMSLSFFHSYLWVSPLIISLSFPPHISEFPHSYLWVSPSYLCVLPHTSLSFLHSYLWVSPPRISEFSPLTSKFLHSYRWVSSTYCFRVFSLISLSPSWPWVSSTHISEFLPLTASEFYLSYLWVFSYHWVSWFPPLKRRIAPPLSSPVGPPPASPPPRRLSISRNRWRGGGEGGHLLTISCRDQWAEVILPIPCCLLLRGTPRGYREGIFSPSTPSPRHLPHPFMFYCTTVTRIDPDQHKKRRIMFTSFYISNICPQQLEKYS